MDNSNQANEIGSRAPCAINPRKPGNTSSIRKTQTATDDHVFDQKLSDVAVSKMLKSVSYPEATVHGLRSSFRDWCGDNTNFSREVCEAALAHAVQNQTEAAYRRSDLFEKRRELMMKWEDYLRIL